MSDDLASIEGAAKALREGTVSSSELVAAAIEQADLLDPVLGVFVSRFDDGAAAAARDADRRLRSGEQCGPLCGIPIVVKDLVQTSDGPTTAQSRVPGPWHRAVDAGVVAHLRAAGAVVVGKSTTMEFGVGLPDPATGFAIPRNPWAPDRWTGGSSSGSAAAVASGIVTAAVGTDTGGSPRFPAALCGITGFKPSYGRLPVDGLVPLSPTLDHVGPMARTARDCAVLANAMAGPGAELDVTSRTTSLTGVRVGIDRRHLGVPGVEPEVAQCFEEAVAVLAEVGAVLVEVDEAWFTQIERATHVVTFHEAFELHRETLRDQWDTYGAFARSPWRPGRSRHPTTTSSPGRSWSGLGGRWRRSVPSTSWWG